MACSNAPALITPHWPAPEWVGAVSTTREGGVSTGAYQQFNLGLHVGDAPDAVQQNREQLTQAMGTRHAPQWLAQVHSDKVITHTQPTQTVPQADASYTRVAELPCAIMTADCLPVLFCSQVNKEVAAAHAGWRGLAGGVLERTLACFDSPMSSIMAWIGPAIGPNAFEVGDEVKAAFEAHSREAHHAFIAYQQRWLCNLPLLAEQRLQQLGIQQIYHSGACTYSDPKRFFSYRRDGVTGRMASLIWIRNNA